MTLPTKSVLIAIVVLMTVLCALSFIPYPPARAEAAAYFTSQEIDTGLQYTFERRLFFWASTAIELAILCGLAFTSLGRRLADCFLSWTGNRRIAAALGIGLLYALLLDALNLPIGIGRLYHARAWGMSNLSLAGWLHDHFLSFGVYLAWEALVLAGFYGLLAGLPRLWWIVAPMGAGVLALAYAYLAPIAIDPLFNSFTPLAQTEWRGLEPRIASLIAKAGVPVEQILVMNASRQSNHTNAYVTGFGATRRIVLYDTLLKNHTDAEVESVLAHEIGHWQNDHITKGILLGMLALWLGCFLLDRLLRFAIDRQPWWLRNIADPAGLPLILLAVYLGQWASMPVETFVSRCFERQADDVSLELARQPEAFIATEIKMARDNKANVAPSPWNVWLFASHPTTVERIETAKAWGSSVKK